MKNTHRGSVMVLVIVFGGIFFTVLVALSGFVLAQNRTQELSRAKAEAINIAEAGLDHYRWYLSHFPGDTQDGTGHAGPYVDTYPDPEGGTAGTYTLTIAGNTACGTIQSIDVTSKGAPADAPTTSSTLWARYAPPSVARYAMILGQSTWFEGTVFRGPLHSNGGLRMDGTTNNAPVTSSVATWTCDITFGCSYQVVEPGVFGNGGNQNLWNYPTPTADFSAIASNFTTMKATAQASGLYFARTSTNQKPYLGYHLIFNANGTVTVKKVTAVVLTVQSVPVDGSTNYGAEAADYSVISNDNTLVGTYAIPANCGVIYVEDNAWIEGTITAKITVISANAANPAGIPTNIVLPNNIVYSAYDGSVGLTAIASHNLLIGANTPQNLTLDGIFVAQSGAFGRNMYDCSSGTNGGQYQYKGTLTMLGSIVSMLRQNNYWSPVWCDNGQGKWSGYNDATWNFVFDRQNSTNPPPFTPTTSSQWQFIDWQQK